MTRSDDQRERGEDFRGDEWPDDEGAIEPHRRQSVGDVFPAIPFDTDEEER